MEFKVENQIAKNKWLEISISSESIITTPNGKQVKGLNSGGRIYRSKPGLLEVKLSNQAIEYDERQFIVVPISDCTINERKYPKIQKIRFRHMDVFLESLENSASISENNCKEDVKSDIPFCLPNEDLSKSNEQAKIIDALEKRIEDLVQSARMKDEENARLRTDNTLLKEHLEKIIPLDEQKKTREVEVKHLQDMVEALDRQCEEMDSQRSSLELRVKTISERIEQLKLQLESSDDEIKKYYAMLSDRIKALYSSIAEKADDVEKEKEDINSMRGEEFIDQEALTTIELKYDALIKELTALQQEMVSIRRKATEHGNIRQKKLYEEHS